MSTMTTPILFHDPTSEPSRAVHWLAIEIGIALELRYTWLTRDEHRDPEFLLVNPGHQVPALQHGSFCLTEAAAIMIYLAELGSVQELWIGSSPEDRANTHRFLSWHHTNARLRLTLDYFLPALLKPAYHGATPPPPKERNRLRARGRESLALLERFLSERGDYLGGVRPNLADLFIAPDLFALDLDPERAVWFEGLPTVSDWLQRLRQLHSYRVSHAPWNAVIPRLQKLLAAEPKGLRDNFWVAEACAPFLPAREG
jgi:glutathione S-transferase